MDASSGSVPLDGGMAEAFIQTLEWLITWWVGSNASLSGWAALDSTLKQLAPVARWLAGALLVLAVIVTVTAGIVQRRGDRFAAVVMSMSGFVVTSAGGWIAMAVAWRFSRAVAHWIVDPQRNASERFVSLVDDALEQIDPGTAEVLAVAGLVASLGLFAALALAAVAAVIVVAVLPAAASIGGLGGPAMTRWALVMAGLLLYQPVTAVIYRIAVNLMTAGADDARWVVCVAIVSLVGSVLALPLLTSTRSPWRRESPVRVPVAAGDHCHVGVNRG